MSILKQILIENGWEVTSGNYLKPSESTLKEIGVNNMHQWNKLIEGERELTISQAKSLSEWLKIPFNRFSELLEVNQ